MAALHHQCLTVPAAQAAPGVVELTRCSMGSARRKVKLAPQQCCAVSQFQVWALIKFTVSKCNSCSSPSFPSETSSTIAVFATNTSMGHLCTSKCSTQSFRVELFQPHMGYHTMGAFCPNLFPIKRAYSMDMNMLNL